MGLNRWWSCSVDDCLPSRIASTMSSASSVSHRARLRYDGRIFSGAARSCTYANSSLSSIRFLRSAFGRWPNDGFWRIAALGFVANNIRLLTKAEAGEPVPAPIYEFAANSFRMWRSIVLTAGRSRSG
jgi:hypothetical protein